MTLDVFPSAGRANILLQYIEVFFEWSLVTIVTIRRCLKELKSILVKDPLWVAS